MITAIFILIVYVIVAMYAVYQTLSYKDFLEKNGATAPQTAIALTEQQKREFLVVFSTLPFTAFKVNPNDTYWINLNQWRSTIIGFIVLFLISLITFFVLLISNF